jgi:hypothetical protein
MEFVILFWNLALSHMQNVWFIYISAFGNLWNVTKFFLGCIFYKHTWFFSFIFFNLDLQLQCHMEVCWSCKELTDAQFEITPKIVHLTTYRIWILPSSCWLGFLHLTIHVRYVKGQMMLIRCCFAIIAMMDTIFFASNQSSLKFLPAFGTIHHVLLQHFDFYSDHATLLPAQVWGGIHENFISASSCIIYICVCVCASLFGWLVSTFD